MKYRVRLDLTFDNINIAKQIFDLAKVNGKILLNTITKENEGYVSLHKCYHDEIPQKSCEIIEEIRTK